jgi:hypothetical protein
MTTGPEAGYYADPSIPGYIRYWDGREWVPGTSRPAPAEPPPAEPARTAPAPQRAPEPRAPQPAPSPDQPEYQAEAQSVATMVVPSAYGNRGAYDQDWRAASPFAGIPGLRAREEEPEEDEPEVRVVELASAGSRVLARCIDLGIATLVSAPATVTLLLVAHRHDHAYIEQLRLQAKTTYRTIGMDSVGIGLWAAALLVVIITAVAFDAVRLPRNGQTTGRRLVGVTTVSTGSAGRVGHGAAFLRSVVFWLLAILPVIDVIALGGVLWGRPYRQGFHEKVSRTITIKA